MPACSIRLLFKIDACEIAIRVHDAESLEDVLMRLLIGPSLVRGMTWISMSSGYRIMQGVPILEDSVLDGDIIVAWPREVLVTEKEATRQAREDRRR